MPTHVGIVGLGNAGSAMATALSRHLPLVGFDVNSSRRDAVAHLQLDWMASLAELARQAGIVIARAECLVQHDGSVARHEQHRANQVAALHGVAVQRDR